MLENCIMGCHGNHAFSHSQNKFLLKDKNKLNSGVQMNNLAPMKNCPGV